MLKNIFFLSSNEFVALTVKEALKKQGVDCYTLTTTHDCFYLIEDLKPQLILFDAALFGKEGELFLKGLGDHQFKMPLIFSGNEKEWSDLTQKDSFFAVLLKPLAPFQIKERLEKLLSQH